MAVDDILAECSSQQDKFIDLDQLSPSEPCCLVCSILTRLCFLSLLLLPIGCRQQSQTVHDAAAGQDVARENEPRDLGDAIAPGASPTEVASAALLAIGTDDKPTLRKLLASKKIKQDIEAITRGRKNFQGAVDNAISFTIVAISSEINGLDKAGRTIDQETITGTTALVTVKGTRAGQQLTKRFFLVQEDNQWLLVPSHR